MGSVTEAVKTFNSTIRTLALAGLVGVVGTGAYIGYQHFTARERELLAKQVELTEVQAKLTSLEAELVAKAAHIEKLETAMHLLKTDQRLAKLNVVKVEKDDQEKVVESVLEFVELSPNGEPLSDPKQFTITGDVVYIDNWVVKFDDKFVEEADIQRGTSLVLFRRAFSEHQQPSEGFSLDEVGTRPQAYAHGGAISEFEKELWSQFWEIANNPIKANEMGIRAANGEAISIQVREGMSYNLQLRSSGGLSFQPVPK